MGFLFGSGKAKTTMPTAVSGLQLQSSTQGLPIPIIYGTTRVAPNLIWYGDFVAIPHQSSTPSAGKGGVGGGGGGKGGGGSVDYTYQTAVALALGEGPIQNVGSVYVNKNVTSLSSLGFSLFTGIYSQSPWGYLTSNHPTQALNYHGIAYLAASAYQLGNSPQLPNHNFEVYGVYSNSISGQVDADPSLVITDLLTNSHYGAEFPASRLGDLSTYQAYTIANGLWVSPYYNQQAQASSILEDLATATNSEFVWSGGLLTLVPYGDESITANGYTYTAPSTPVYDLTDDDFISAPGEDPVILMRKRPADAINSIKLECLNRSNSYNAAVIEAKDQALIDAYGLRQQPKKDSHLFADLTAGRLSAQLQLQRQAIRNQYQFTLDQRYILLDPMDIVTLTDSNLGLDRQWVRILEITEMDDGTLQFIAEEYLNGTGNAPAYSFEPDGGYTVDYNEAPGDANTPVIFEPPVQISYTGGLEVDMAVSGGTLWGGCDIWISTDGDTYKNIGRVNGPARHGVLSAGLASGSDPDESNTLSVDLSQSLGELNSGTKNDADNNHTLCYVDGEYVSYETATLTAANQYDLTYLRRGQFGSTIAAHSAGTQFARMDAGIFSYAYDKSKIGQTLYVKLLSFNIYGGGLQSLADVAAYTHTLTGPPLPEQVQGFQVQQQGNVVAFNWEDVSTDSALKGYDIAYGPAGSSWEEKTFLTEAHRGTEMTNASVPPGTWEFAIRAHDIADNLGPQNTASLTVVNSNTAISSIDQEPEWNGTISGFFRHYTGVLTPLSSQTVDQYAALNAPSAPTLGDVSGGSVAGNTWKVRITYVTATGETLYSDLSSHPTSTGELLTVSSPPASGDATGYNVYVNQFGGGSLDQKLQNASPIPIGANWTMPATGYNSGGASLPTVNTTGWEVFDKFVPDPVSSAYYIAPSVDTGYDDTLRVYSTIDYGSGFGETGTPDISFEIDTWKTAETDPDTFTPWLIGTVSMRYIRSKLVYDGITEGSVAYVKGFIPIVDKVPVIESAVVSVAPGGTTVTFPAQFHAPPYVLATVISGTALFAEVTDITSTDCVINVYDSTDTSVGGTVNYTASGE